MRLDQDTRSSLFSGSSLALLPSHNDHLLVVYNNHEAVHLGNGSSLCLGPSFSTSVKAMKPVTPGAPSSRPDATAINYALDDP